MVKYEILQNEANVNKIANISSKGNLAVKQCGYRVRVSISYFNIFNCMKEVEPN